MVDVYSYEEIDPNQNRSPQIVEVVIADPVFSAEIFALILLVCGFVTLFIYLIRMKRVLFRQKES